MNIRARLTGVVAGSALALGAAVGMAPSAAAVPSGCYSWTDAGGGNTRCTTGSGQVRSMVWCRGLLGLYGSTAYGPWDGVGQTSRAQCPLGTYPSWAGIGGLR